MDRRSPAMVDSSRTDRFAELVDWMVAGAQPSANARDIIDGICQRVTGIGVPVDRFMLFIFTLHPNLQGRRFRWMPGAEIDMAEAQLGTFSTDLYWNNPIPDVVETKRSIRRHLERADCPDDYTIIGELREQGFTDYLVQPLVFITGETHACSWSSKRPGGFSDDELSMLERIAPPLARLTETYMLRLNAATLLSTYVGRDSGHKILSGRVHRGDGEEISAVILFVDLKDFTRLGNRMPGKALIELLNDAFDRLVPGVLEEGGEILKFMGDGFFAIFPYEQEGDVAAAARAAIAAVRSGRGRLEGAEMATTVSFRSAVHFGTFHYGNIGGADRLDFTAIGAPVNFAARLLSAAAELGVDDAISSELAAQLPGQCREAGCTRLKGFDGDHSVWTY